MMEINLQNPFGAPVFFMETVSSTMDACRNLAADSAAHGTVVFADFQESGRGRRNRLWETRKGTSLMFTIFLDYPDFEAMPKALTLKAGLAAVSAIEDIIPAFGGLTQVKWPNDILLLSKKISGILVETELSPGLINDKKNNTRVFIGMGVNILQEDFPRDLQHKAGSFVSVFREKFPGSSIPSFFYAKDTRAQLLQRILFFLKRELDINVDSPNQELSWKNRLGKRLYKRGEQVIFANGAAGSRELIHGRLENIGEDGELLIIPQGGTQARPFINGELQVY